MGEFSREGAMAIPQNDLFEEFIGRTRVVERPAGPAVPFSAGLGATEPSARGPLRRDGGHRCTRHVIERATELTTIRYSPPDGHCYMTVGELRGKRLSAWHVTTGDARPQQEGLHRPM